MIAFINSFLSYLLLFIIFAAIMVVAIILGKKLRDSKDKKDALKASADASLNNTEE